MPEAFAPPSPGALRACMSRFATGVTVVSYATDSGPRGATMNSFTSVSAEPPPGPLPRPAGRRALLREHPRCRTGAVGPAVRGGPEHRWAEGARVPRLVDPLAWVECEPWRAYDGGDHTLVVGRVTGLGHRDGDALTYAWSRFSSTTESTDGIEHLF